jgi:hypothetical protein
MDDFLDCLSGFACNYDRLVKNLRQERSLDGGIGVRGAGGWCSGGARRRENSYPQENQIKIDRLGQFCGATDIAAAPCGIDSPNSSGYFLSIFRATSPQLGLFSVGN